MTLVYVNIKKHVKYVCFAVSVDFWDPGGYLPEGGWGCVPARGGTCLGGCTCLGGTWWGCTLLGGVPARGGCTCPGGYLPGGGVYLPGGCTCPGGVPARGVYLPGGCTCPGGVPAWRGGVPARGGACPGGCSCLGGVPSDLSHHAFDVTCMLPPHQMRPTNTAAAYIVLVGHVTCKTFWDTHPPCEQNHTHLKKHNLAPTSLRAVNTTQTE